MSAWFRQSGETRRGVIRRRISFYGEVQAVGFRYRAVYAARNYGATGWVRNEYDGSVTMEIQGTEEDIDRVIRSLNSDMYIRIERMESRDIPADPEERTFRVAY